MTLIALAALALQAAYAAPCDPAAAVKAFAAAADARDLSSAEAVLHPDFRVAFAVAGSGEATQLDRATWLSLLEGGKIGGTPRTIDVAEPMGDTGLSVVRATLTGGGARFESTYVVVAHEGRCMLLQDATLYSPPAQ